MNLPCKQAVIMTAYNDFPFILINISRMTEYFDVFIHIDKRSKVPSEFYNQIERFPNVHVISKHKVLWGSYKHPEAILDLLSIAKEYGPYSYYHIISANTMCAESYEKTYSFYQKEYENGWHNFLELAEIEKSQQKEYLLSRQNGWYFLHRYNSKPVNLFERLNKFFWNRIENVLTAVRFPKKLQFEYRYKGYVYSHLSGPFVTWLFENLDGIVLPALKEIKHFWVGEEFFFQMLIMYSPYGAEAVNASQIYSEWFSPERGMPAFLNADDYPSILASGKPFIRKVSSDKSGDLIRRIFESESRQ